MEGRTGGKGGGGNQQPTPPTNTFSYKKSFAILVCGTPVKSYRRISENLEAIYNNVGSELREDFYEAEHHSLSGGVTIIEDGECSGGRSVRLAGSGQYVEVRERAGLPERERRGGDLGQPRGLGERACERHGHALPAAGREHHQASRGLGYERH
jgi:hypothetical protein